MIRKIVTLPHPTLRTAASQVKQVDKNLHRLILDLTETLKVQKEPEGLGLAANQLGETKRVFVAKIGKKIFPFINPEIISVDSEEIALIEGCLSVPKIYSKIKRPKKITLRYQIIANQSKDEQFLISKEENFDELTARVIQHETDHLFGIVFLDLALKQNAPLYKLMKRNGKEELEEIIL